MFFSVQMCKAYPFPVKVFAPYSDLQKVDILFLQINEQVRLLVWKLYKLFKL